MEDSVISRINKMGKIGVIVTRILKIFFILQLLLCLTILFFWGYVPKGMITLRCIQRLELETDESLFPQSQDMQYNFLNSKARSHTLDHSEKTEQGYRFWGEQLQYEIDDGGTFMFLFVIYFIIFYPILHYGGRLCRSIRSCRSPFDPDVIQKMKKLQLAMIPWAFISIFTDALAPVFLMNARPSLTVNLDLLVVIFVLYSLMFIFQYGAQLQRESDETI